MSQTQRFKAKKDFKLDCGHEVKSGQEFLVTKVFTCEEDAKHLPHSQKPKSDQTEQK